MAKRGRGKHWSQARSTRTTHPIDRLFKPGDLVMKGPPGKNITDEEVNLAMVIWINGDYLHVLTPFGGGVWHKIETRRVFPYDLASHAEDDTAFEDEETEG